MSLFEQWLEEEKVRLKKPSYLHFDDRISPSKLEANLKLLQTPQAISRYSFFPLLSSTLITPRYKFAEQEIKRTISKKERPIKYAAHLDSVIYSWYGKVIDDLYSNYLHSKDFSNCPTAYRKLGGKSNAHFAKEIFDFIRDSKSDCVAVCFDIEKFFDNLDHKILKRNWRRVIRKKTLPPDHFKIYSSLTRYSSVNKAEIFKFLKISKRNPPRRLCSSLDFRNKVRPSGLIEENTKGKGIPQGSNMSGVLSNIYMISFDHAINKFVLKNGGIYRRYSDDIIVVIPPESLNKMVSLIQNQIKLVNLEIQNSKTQKVYFHRQTYRQLKIFPTKSDLHILEYLGFEFDGKNVFIKSSTLGRYYRNSKQAIKKNVFKAFKSRTNKGIVYKRKLYTRYTHLGRQRFINYVSTSQAIFDSLTIKRQLRNHFKRIKATIDHEVSTHQQKFKYHPSAMA